MHAVGHAGQEKMQVFVLSQNLFSVSFNLQLYFVKPDCSVLFTRRKPCHSIIDGCEPME